MCSGITLARSFHDVRKYTSVHALVMIRIIQQSGGYSIHTVTIFFLRSHYHFFYRCLRYRFKFKIIFSWVLQIRLVGCLRIFDNIRSKIGLYICKIFIERICNFLFVLYPAINFVCDLFLVV